MISPVGTGETISLNQLNYDEEPFIVTDNSVLTYATIDGYGSGLFVVKAANPDNSAGSLNLANDRRELMLAQDIEGVVRMIPTFSKKILLMELAEGGNLRDKPRTRTKEGVLEDWQILRGIATTAIQLHDRGVIHRDLKLANMLIGDQPLIADFGLASQKGEAPTSYLKEDIIGTINIWSPEVIKGSIDLIESDVYAFWVSVYERLTCRQVWLDDRESFSKITPEELLRRMLNYKPHFSRADKKIIDPKLIEKIEGGLDPKPKSRAPLDVAISDD